MNPNYIPFLLILLSFLSSSQSQFSDFLPPNRRILHQPLFPSQPPPPPPPPLPLPPPGPDQPFFHELPNGQDQGQPLLPQAPPTTSSTQMANPVPSRASSPAKKVAIAITSAVLTLAMLSALAFYLCKHRDDSQKLVAANSRGFIEESRMPSSTFLYIGTVDPSGTSIATGSPYRKLNSGKISERYRPSPDLQPLPPLTKPPPPPPMSESPDFYTPQGSSMSINESPRSRQSQLNNNSKGKSDHRGSAPHSKRTSPKSRLPAPSPDTKSVIIPSIKYPLPPQPPAASSLGPLQPSKTLSYNPPKRPKFLAPPDMVRLRSISNDDQQPPKIPVPAPPPPPPNPSILTKIGAVQTHLPEQVIRPQSNSPNGEPNSGSSEKTSSSVEPNKKGVSSSEKINDGEDKEGSKPKLKPLHWDKVRNTSDRATVWDQLKSSSFQLNEDAMESLFGCNSANSVTKEATRKSVQSTAEQEIRVLDPKKSQNIAILLRAVNVTKEEVSEALLDGNPEGLGPELLETLVKMAPTKEEEIKLRDYDGESSRLGSTERFLKAILNIPFAFKRVEAMLYRANFDAEVTYLRKSFQTLEKASEELKNSRLFLKLLEAVLRTGNRMNDGTNRGDARAFKLDTLLKLVDVKGTDGKTTLLHFVVQEIVRSEGAKPDPGSESQANKLNSNFKEEEFKKQELQLVAGLSKELGNVKRAAGMDSDVLSSYVSKLDMGLEKVKSVMQHSKQSMQGKFFDSMKEFISEATVEITRIKAEERKALSLVREVTEYFHGDAAKEEAHPFRIFMIVRDFLSILDNVCKDVGRMHDRATMGTGRSFRMPAVSSLPVLNRYNERRYGNSDDDGI